MSEKSIKQLEVLARIKEKKIPQQHAAKELKMTVHYVKSETYPEQTLQIGTPKQFLNRPFG